MQRFVLRFLFVLLATLGCLTLLLAPRWTKAKHLHDLWSNNLSSKGISPPIEYHAIPKDFNVTARESPTVYHIIPQSHCDAAYKKTFDEYYETEVRTIFHSMLNELHRDKDRRFVWSETIYLVRWWKDPRTSKQQRAQFHEFLIAGRIEIVNGGWVMHDEAVTRYDSQIHQMTEGHDRLQQMLLDHLRRPNVSVTTGWQIDPFGPSPFSVNLHDWADMDMLVLNRMPSNIKDALKKNQTLQFHWETEQARIFVHVMDTHYGSPDGFDWENIEHGEPIPITNDNVQQRSDLFMDVLTERATYYRTPHVMIPIGGDFTFQNASLQFANMERITDFVQHHPERYGSNSFRYSTPSQYREAVMNAFAESQQAIPVIHNGVEFQPLWVGYYFQLPSLKQMLRSCEIVLRTVEIHLFRNFQQGLSWTQISQSIESMRPIRDTVALMQHHDAITATSYRFVIADYMGRLAFALESMTSLLSHLTEDTGRSRFIHFRQASNKQGQIVGGGPYIHETVYVRDGESARSIHVRKIVRPQMSASGTLLVVLNSLGQEITTIVHFVCTRDDVAVSLQHDDGSVEPILSQATPLDEELKVSNLGLFLISFPVMMSGFGQSNYRVDVCDLTWNTFQDPPVYIPSLECAHKAEFLDSRTLVKSGLASTKLQVDFNDTTHELASLTYSRENGDKISSPLDHDFVLYYGGNDTIYQFKTSLESSDPPTLFGPRPRRFVSGYHGVLFSQVTLEYTPWLSVRYRLTNLTCTLLDDALQATVFAGPLPPSVDLASRFRTKWSPSTPWWLDQNGFLPVEVSYNSSHGVGDWNTRPFVSRSWINENSVGRRLTVHTVDPRAVVSKRSGEMDVFWHRRNNFTPDWWKQGEDQSSIVSSVWITLLEDTVENEAKGRHLATQLSNDMVLLAKPMEQNQNTKNENTNLRMGSALGDGIHCVTLRLSQTDSDIDPNREEAWVDVQLENVSAKSSEQVNLVSFFQDSSKVILSAATLNSITFLNTKSAAADEGQGSFDGCSLEITEGGKDVILTIDVRRICSVRVPVAPLHVEESNDITRIYYSV